jgi:agmatinase
VASKNKFQTIACECFPFDVFGSAGSSEGAKLLIDLIQEIIDDSEQESLATRTDEFASRIQIDEQEFKTVDAIKNWQLTGQRHISKHLEKKDTFTLWLGGNHLSILPVYEALREDDLIIQFDAHLDVYHLHDNIEEPSHGNFIRDAKISAPLVNIGNRDLFLHQEEINKYFDEVISEHYDILLFKKLKKYVAKAKRIWIDIDIDVIDPAFCPAVSTPLPFGMLPQTLLQWLSKIWATDKVVGMSLSEFLPASDRDSKSLELLGWLVEWSLLQVK